MPARRRATDDEDEDHVSERNTDWRMSPRPVLVVAIYALMGMLSFLGSFSYWVLADKIARIEAAASDPKWDVLLEHSHDIGELKRRAEQEAAFRDEIRREFDRLNLRLSKKGL